MAKDKRDDNEIEDPDVSDEKKKGVSEEEEYSSSARAAVLEEYYARIKKRVSRRSSIIKLVSLGIGLLLSVAIVSVCAYVYLRVDTIEIEGSTVYSDEEIIAGSGIVLGENIMKVNSERVAAAVGGRMPFIHSVKVTRSLPDKVIIKIYEENPYFYFRVVNQYVVVSSDLKVLKIFDSEDELKGLFPKLKNIKTPDVLYAVVGQPLKLFDSQDAEFIVSLVNELNSSTLGSSISAVDASNRFDMKVTYDDRMVIELGNTKNLSSKLIFADHIIKSFTEDTKGTVNVEDVSSGYAIVDYPNHLIVFEQ